MIFDLDENTDIMFDTYSEYVFSFFLGNLVQIRKQSEREEKREGEID